MTYNKLKLNENKTEFLIIGSPFNLKNLPDIELTVGNSAIRPSESARNLGVYFDCTMSMASHITYIICYAILSGFIYSIFPRSENTLIAMHVITRS